jgi:hypothetical protein
MVRTMTSTPTTTRGRKTMKDMKTTKGMSTKTSTMGVMVTKGWQQMGDGNDEGGGGQGTMKEGGP